MRAAGNPGARLVAIVCAAQVFVQIGAYYWPALLPDPTPQQIDAAIAAGDTAYGTPDEVEVAIRKYADAGVDQVVFGLLSSTMERDLAFETIETFGKHVLPVFDTDRVHRTTRQREAAGAASAT